VNSAVRVNGQFIDWNEHLTVEKILDGLELEFKQYIVKVNEKIVKKDQYEAKAVPRGAKVRILPLLPGG